MKSLLKIVAWIVAIVVVVIAVAAIVAPLVVNPNDYKPQIAHFVEQQTGRTFEMKGDIKLSVFPWLGLKLGPVSLGNAAGFGAAPFASIQRAEVRIKLLPLLHGKKEIDTVVLDGLHLNLVRNQAGVGNWEGLGGKPAAGAAPKAKSAPAQSAAKPANALAGLSIGGVEVDNANVSWDDRRSGSHYTVDDLDFTSGAIGQGETTPVKLAFELKSAKPALDAKVKFSTKATVDLDAQSYRLADTRLTVDAKGAGLPAKGMSAQLAAAIRADLAKQTLAVTGLKLTAAGLTLDGSVNGREILSHPALSGSLNSNEFVPRETLADLGVKLPAMADPSALTKAKLGLRFTAGTDNAALQSIDLKLDDSTLTGSASVHNFARPAIRYRLALDKIDADRYLPPPAKGAKPAPAAATPATAGAAAAMQLPVKTLRRLNIDGTFTVGSLKLENLRSTDIKTTLRADRGVIHLYPVSAKLYDGSYNGNLTFDVSGSTPRSSMDEKLAGVQAGPLLKDLMGKDYVTGVANLSAKMTARGIDPMAVRKSLNGNAAFSFRNGMVKGVNVALLIRKAYAAFKGEPAPANEPEQTDFTSLTGSLKVTNGLVRNNDLKASSPLLRVDGAGTANLVSERLDYTVKTAIVGTLAGEGGKKLAELKNVTIPIHVTGTFSSPHFGLDMGQVLQGEARNAAKKRIEKEREKLRNKLQDRLKGLFK